MRKLVILLSAGTLVGLIAGCGSSGTTSTGASTKASTGSTARSAGAGIAGPAPAPAAAAPDVQPADASAALGRDVVRTGTLTLQTTDVPGTIARATATVRAAAGYVESEQAAIDPKDHRQDNALLTLKVPGSAYDSVLPTLSRLGTLLGSEDQRQDVTGDVVDAARRLASEEASVARVRALLSRARTIGEVVSVESELTKRETSLESLKGRLAALKGQVSYATITMNLSTPAAAPKPPKPTPAGFLAGLRSGWHTFAAVLVGLLTPVGAALPFAGTLLALGGLGWAVRRRIVRRPAAAPAD